MLADNPFRGSNPEGCDETCRTGKEGPAVSHYMRSGYPAHRLVDNKDPI